MQVKWFRKTIKETIMNASSLSGKSRIGRVLCMALLLTSMIAAPVLIAGQTRQTAGSANAPAEVGKLEAMIEFNKVIFDGIKGILLRSAEKMPEEKFNFRPTDAVRTYGQILAHIADTQYYFGSLVLGEQNPAPQIEKTKTTKADIIAALQEAFAYFDKAFASLNEGNALETVKLFYGDNPKLGVLTVNSLHSIEHYGNLVTYMRIHNIVPPTSEQNQ